jgi:hypothetical protein
MDVKNSLNYRYKYIKNYNLVNNTKYNYVDEGILCKCLPKVLFKGNSIFVTFLQLIDLRIIMLFKYIDRLKHFKYISWYK